MDFGKIFADVSKYCHDKLLFNKEVLAYLIEDRTLDLDIIKKFQIGLFPKDLRELFAIINPEELRTAGIIKNASKSIFKLQDLVIPIKDVYGNYIAISGRTRVDEHERKKRKIPKYINSVYNKSHHLFGLNFARKAIFKANKVYVVEGYYDVIKSHQKNITNIVAICGVFLSFRHLVLLSRYTDNIILMFDNEPEAQKRANNIIEKRKCEGISLSVINPLPESIKDVDEFLRTNSAENLLLLLEDGNFNNIKPFWD